MKKTKMVRTTQRKLRNDPAACKTEKTCSRRSLTQHINAKAPTTTPIKNKKTQVFRVRKCVVKIKRLKHKTNDLSKTPPSALTSSENAGNSSAFHPTRNSTMCIPGQLAGGKITPLTVRIRNLVKVPNTIHKPQYEQDQLPAASKSTATPPKRGHRFFHRDEPPTRSRSSVTRHVYEFLSHSQVEDNEVEDPAADIIKKMIKDGRACVMTRLKSGKNRVRCVKKRVRPLGKRKKCTVRNIAEKPITTASETQPRPLSPIYEPQNDSSINNIENNPAVRIEVPVQVHAQPGSAQSRGLTEGVYSPLARSLLLNKTNTHDPQPSMERRRHLLNMAKKFISTPLNRKISTVDPNTTKLSPIVKSSRDMQAKSSATVVGSSGGSSPWRVPDETNLPNTFVFGLNTSQLPSYSSDFIRSRHVYVPDGPDPLEEQSFCPSPREQCARSTVNDSNGENVPPPAATAAEEQPRTPFEHSDGQENENAENFVQLPNPRRTLQHRSPLKDINILDVVVLPSWKKNLQPPKTPTRECMAKTQNYCSPTPLCARPERQIQQPTNLFGFEDFLTENEVEPSRLRDVSQNVTLHDRLQRLKGLRPTDKQLSAVSKAPMRHAYDDMEAGKPKQGNIKEMLCSTMVASAARLPRADESFALFKDIDPETTFDEKQPRRTYVRERPKRKRKQRVRVLFIDSDSSEGEENEQDSREHDDGSPIKAPPQKRTRKDIEQDTKLQQFIASFNQECAEVEQFPLIVE